MKAMAFIDYENIWKGLTEKGYKLVPEEFIQILYSYAEQIDVELRAVYLYANFDKEEFWRTQTAFENKSIYTRHIFGKNSYSNTEVRQNAADLELILEAQEILLTRPSSVDLFLLFTGDGDFFSLVRKIRACGKEIKIIGISGNIHKILEPYCESFDIFCDLLSQGQDMQYNTGENVEESIRILAELQIRLPYIASTKARVMLSKKMNKPLQVIKDLVQFLIENKIILEKEHPDPNLVIKKTKIYLLNMKHSTVQKVLSDYAITELKKRYAKL